jgi:hypothetical protein
MVLVTDTGTVIVATDQQRAVLLCTVNRGSHGRTKVVWKEHFAVPKKENSAAPRHLSTNKGTVHCQPGVPSLTFGNSHTSASKYTFTNH